jgi:hypothetical protein
MPSQSPHRPPPLPPRRASDSDVCWMHPTTPLPSVSTTTETKPAMRPSRCSSVVDIAATTANETTGDYDSCPRPRSEACRYCQDDDCRRTFRGQCPLWPRDKCRSCYTGFDSPSPCIHLALSATGIFQAKNYCFYVEEVYCTMDTDVQWFFVSLLLSSTRTPRL